MRRLLALAVVVPIVLPAAAWARPSTTTGSLVVTLRAPATAAQLGARPGGYRVPQIGLVTVRPRAGAGSAALARRLRADPRVVTVERERRAHPRFLPDDPALRAVEAAPGTAPGTPVQWWATRSGFERAWDHARGENTLVAVIDTGVDATHPELADRLAGAASFDPQRPAAAVDEVGHGTHVASIACGAGNNAVALAGAGLRCRRRAIKTSFSDSSVAAAIVWAADRGADAINLSFGSPPGSQPSSAVRRAVTYAARRGAVLVAAAADDPIEDQGHPANLVQPAGSAPDLAQNRGLSVTAATHADVRASFAGFGPQVSMAAYGSYSIEQGTGPAGIFGAFTSAPNELERGGAGSPPRPPCACRTTFGADARYAYLEGTSMATAMVSGAAALVHGLNPDLRPPEIVRLLKESARRLPGTGWGPELGWGILDAGAAVELARRMDRRAPRSQVEGLPARTTARRVTVRWDGADRAPRGVRRAGVARYLLYLAVDGGPRRRVLTTGRTSRRFVVRPGRRYALTRFAVDRACYRVRMPSRAD